MSQGIKLPADQRSAIARRLAAAPASEVAGEFGVSAKTVRRIATAAGMVLRRPATVGEQPVGRRLGRCDPRVEVPERGRSRVRVVEELRRIPASPGIPRCRRPPERVEAVPRTLSGDACRLDKIAPAIPEMRGVPMPPEHLEPRAGGEQADRGDRLGGEFVDPISSSTLPIDCPDQQMRRVEVRPVDRQDRRDPLRRVEEDRDQGRPPDRSPDLPDHAASLGGDEVEAGHLILGPRPRGLLRRVVGRDDRQRQVGQPPLDREPSHGDQLGPLLLRGPRRPGRGPVFKEPRDRGVGQVIGRGIRPQPSGEGPDRAAVEPGRVRRLPPQPERAVVVGEQSG